MHEPFRRLIPQPLWVRACAASITTNAPPLCLHLPQLPHRRRRRRHHQSHPALPHHPHHRDGTLAMARSAAFAWWQFPSTNAPSFRRAQMDGRGGGASLLRLKSGTGGPMRVQWRMPMRRKPRQLRKLRHLRSQTHVFPSSAAGSATATATFAPLATTVSFWSASRSSPPTTTFALAGTSAIATTA
jgi:hypothetical protein